MSLEETLLGTRILVLGRAALPPPRADRLDVSLVSLHFGPIRPRCQLDQRVERYGYPGTLFLRLLHKVRINAADDGLMRDDEDVLAALQLHDDGLEADHHVAVAFASTVSVVVLVFVARLEVIGVKVRYLLVRHSVANASVELVESLPL